MKREVDVVRKEQEEAIKELDDVRIRLQVNMVTFRDFKDLADLVRLQKEFDYLMAELDRARRKLGMIDQELWNLENGEVLYG